jgi:predicted peptidase
MINIFLIYKNRTFVFKKTMQRYAFFLFVIIFSTACFSTQKTVENTDFEVKIDTLNLFDQTRNRKIPLALYFPTSKKKKVGIVIFNHGYGQNKGGDNIAYSYLTKKIATKGYFVASIQHELPTDELLPLTGKPQVVRRPFWDRGADNILFVINELRRIKPDLDFENITLIGHSNGGDMTALFSQKYPNIVKKIITLDNRRMALPRMKNLKVFSLRSSDQPADEGVLPTESEQNEFNIKIIKLPNTIHNDMDDHANESQRKEINDYILDFLSQ